VLIVMVIVTILAGVGLAMYNNSVIRAKEAVLKEDLFQLREAIDQYYADKNKWPPTLDALVTDKYIRRIPEDPITGTADWRTTFGEPDPGNPASEAGISDVHSATSEVSPLTGTPYSEW
jgi:general secretion pathway protein G